MFLILGDKAQNYGKITALPLLDIQKIECEVICTELHVEVTPKKDTWNHDWSKTWVYDFKSKKDAKQALREFMEYLQSLTF